MNEPNEFYNTELGYGNSSYSNELDLGYEPDGYGSAAASAYGAGDTTKARDIFSDGYSENVFEVNFFDTLYTETVSNPNPGVGNVQPQSVDLSNYTDYSNYSDEMEL